MANLNIEAIKPSSRKYPYVGFKFEREMGNDVLDVSDLAKTVDGQMMFKNFRLHAGKEERIALIGRFDKAKTALFQILMGEMQQDAGTFKWGFSTSRAYFPKDNKKYFESDLNLIDWLRQYSENKDENFVRGFLGRMLFSGEETFKSARVLSGGEKVRCMLSRMMLASANVLVLDEPTNHLDLESIMALNDGLKDFKGTVLFASHDHQFVQTVANRIIEITPNGYIDQMGTTLDEYLENETIHKRREALYEEQIPIYR